MFKASTSTWSTQELWIIFNNIVWSFFDGTTLLLLRTIMAQDRNQQQQVEQELKKTFEELKGSLAEKEEQISRAVREIYMRSLMHVETLAELSSTE